MARPTFFFIDGNNQMYRAYHAIRGLSGPDGSATNAVYGFVTMLRKLIADHHPDYILASFDLAGPTFRDSLSADYKANRTPMPPDLVEQVAACTRPRCAGRADRHGRGLRGRRRHRHAGEEGRGRGIRRGDRHRRQGLLSTRRRPDSRVQSEGRGRVVRRRGGGPEVRCPPRSGRRRARADGRLDRQREGRAGHRREGRARAHRVAWHARRAAREGGGRAAEAVSRSAGDLRRSGAAQPRAAEDPDGRRRAVRGGTLRVLGGEPRAVLRPLLEARVPDAVDGIRAHGRDHPQAIRRRRRQRRTEPSRPRRRGRRRDRGARPDRRRKPDARDDRRLRDRDRAAHRLVRPCRAHGRQPARSRPGRLAARRESWRPQAASRTRNAAEDRARLEDRRRRAGASWRDARGAGPRHDDRELPDRPDALRAHA